MAWGVCATLSLLWQSHLFDFENSSYVDMHEIVSLARQCNSLFISSMVCEACELVCCPPDGVALVTIVSHPSVSQVTRAGLSASLKDSRERK